MQNQSIPFITPATVCIPTSELSAEDLEFIALWRQVDPAAKAAFRAVIELRLLIDQLPAHQQPYLRQLAIELMQPAALLEAG